MKRGIVELSIMLTHKRYWLRGELPTFRIFPPLPERRRRREERSTKSLSPQPRSRLDRPALERENPSGQGPLTIWNSIHFSTFIQCTTITLHWKYRIHISIHQFHSFKQSLKYLWSQIKLDCKIRFVKAALYLHHLLFNDFVLLNTYTAGGEV